AIVELRSKRGSAWGWALFGFAITIAAALLFMLAFALGLARAHDGRFMPGVAVAGVSVAGLDRGQAETQIREELPALSSGRISLAVEDSRTTVPYAQLARDYDMDSMLDAAYAFGRRGNDVAQTLDQLRGLLYGASVGTAVRYEPAAVDGVVADVAARYDRDPRDATMALNADGRSFAAAAGMEGRRVDQAALRRAIVQVVDTTDPADASVQLRAQPIEPAITTAEAEAAVAEAKTLTARPLTLKAEDDKLTIDRETLRRWILFDVEPEGSVRPVFVTSRVRTALEGLAPQVERAARNASFRFGGNAVSAVVPAVNGRSLEIEGSVEAVTAALKTPKAEPAIELALTSVAPSLTTAEAEAAAPKMRQISTWTTRYTPSEKNFFGKNISIPTSVIDGYVVGAGEWFSFWEAVGDVSVNAGYGAGGAIINGRTEPTGALAGGICSCSTTLFNAAARAGLEMGARRNHYYYIDRYPVGLDATVFKSDSSVQDMTFRNDTEFPILIRGINGSGTVRFDIYGVDTGRTVSFSEPVVRNYRNATDSVEYTSALPAGSSKRVEYPVNGFESTVVRTVRNASGAVIHQDTYYSNYAVITGIVLVGR
ncbi:MAG: VanW family protein, partial [Candidatus Limnocylindrales bacterium]